MIFEMLALDRRGLAICLIEEVVAFDQALRIAVPS